MYVLDFRYCVFHLYIIQIVTYENIFLHKVLIKERQPLLINYLFESVPTEIKI